MNSHTRAQRHVRTQVPPSARYRCQLCPSCKIVPPPTARSDREQGNGTIAMHGDQARTRDGSRTTGRGGARDRCGDDGTKACKAGLVVRIVRPRPCTVPQHYRTGCGAGRRAECGRIDGGSGISGESVGDECLDRAALVKWSSSDRSGAGRLRSGGRDFRGKCLHTHRIGRRRRRWQRGPRNRSGHCHQSHDALKHRIAVRHRVEQQREQRGVREQDCCQQSCARTTRPRIRTRGGIPR